MAQISRGPIADLRRVHLTDINPPDLAPGDKIADRILTEDQLARISLLAPPILIQQGTRYNCVGNKKTLLFHRATMSSLKKSRVSSWVLRDDNWQPQDWQLLEESRSLLSASKLTVRSARRLNAMLGELPSSDSETPNAENLSALGSGCPDEKS